MYVQEKSKEAGKGSQRNDREEGEERGKRNNRKTEVLRKWRPEFKMKWRRTLLGCIICCKVENTIQLLDSGGERENDRKRENEI